VTAGLPDGPGEDLETGSGGTGFLAVPGPDDLHDIRGLLGYTAFRRLWIALSLSSLGDWLGLLATSSMAIELVKGYSAAAYALGGVLFIRLLPALLLGPLAGALADRWDRRWTMVGADVLRCGLYVSIPVVHTLPWLLVASFLIEAASLFWIPAKEASVPNLVPKERLETANQLSLLTTYGSAPFASALFALLALFNSALAAAIPFFKTNPVNLALYFDAATFLFSAATIFGLHGIGGRRAQRRPNGDGSSIARDITEGWRFVGQDRLLRGLIIGMLGGFAAAGTVIALGRVFVHDLRGGNAGYGVIFGTLFIGLAAGMFGGPRLFTRVSRRRLLGCAIFGAGASLVATALAPNLLIAVGTALGVGAFAGVAWVVGYTLVGKHVADELRGRTFAFLYTLMRVVLLLVLAAAPVLAGLIGDHRVHLGNVGIRMDGVTLVLLNGGLLAMLLGALSYRQMDDRRGVSLYADLKTAVGGRSAVSRATSSSGLFIAFEGGDGSGKSTQAALLAEALRGQGYEVVLTREPGATPAGKRLRDLLLDPASAGLSPRAEALLYAADRADHVTRLVRPALERGAVVITDRYVDSSLAYQGGGRELTLAQVERLNNFATDHLVPHLTVLLDIRPEVGLARAAAPTRDRLEAEPASFHGRVRRGFRDLATRDPNRYLVMDAGQPPAEIARRVLERVRPLLPPAEMPADRQSHGSLAVTE
jgi:dTMP kinase